MFWRTESKSGRGKNTCDASKDYFADEPTGNLDGVRSKQLMQYLEKVNREKNITVIMVTHDPLDAAYSSQMYYIEDGKIKDHY